MGGIIVCGIIIAGRVAAGGITSRGISWRVEVGQQRGMLLKVLVLMQCTAARTGGRAARRGERGELFARGWG